MDACHDKGGLTGPVGAEGTDLYSSYVYHQACAAVYDAGCPTGCGFKEIRGIPCPAPKKGLCFQAICNEA